MKTALARIGFETGVGWNKVAANSAKTGMEKQFQALLRDLQAGVPSIVCMHYDDSPDTTEHFRLILGFDADKQEVIYHEPAEDDGAYRRMTKADFMRRWPLKYSRDSWTVIRFALRGEVRARASTARFTNADFAQHLMALKDRTPKGFHVAVERPFVVIGDIGRAAVEQRASGTVRWVTEQVKHFYFEKDPEAIIDIWLFRDRSSYEKHCWDLFRTIPSTPFGFYSSEHRALIMNISTGGGTLVHEMIHPFIESNFPTCPSWFDEGLASLYEQSGSKKGAIHGLTNWRLAGLQEAIRDGNLPSFKTLCSTNSMQFYERDPGTNYAQARYLCYYLQERDLLRKFYHAFQSSKTDKQGYATLCKTLGRDQDEMARFQKGWEKWILGLRFP